MSSQHAICLMALPYSRISFLTRKTGGLRNSLAIPSKVKTTHSRRYPCFSNYNTDHCEAEVLTIGPKVLEGERRLVSEPVIKTYEDLYNIPQEMSQAHWKLFAEARY